ncbi:MAG TPA: peptidoglycan DD-metalloendopeptidase family protein [Thermoanaerobaculia bacterium]|nr:peptidoglycan DD-metalloendopeptidase family protein [Thermoanaerobaculia bacterium]
MLIAAGPGDDRESDLARLRDRIAELESGIAALDASARDLLERYTQARAEVELQRARVAESEAALALTAERRVESEQRVGVLEAELAERRLRLGRRIRSISRFGGHGYLRLLLAVDADADLLSALRQLRFLIRRDAEALAGFRQTRDQLAAELDRLDRLQRETAEWLSEERARQTRLEELLGEQRSLVRQVENRRDGLRRQAETLEVKERRLERLVAALAEEAPEPLAGVPIQELRGALDWPAAGRVVREFGPRRDPRYGTVTPHHGIEIALAEPELVRVVYPGTVRYAAVFQDFGFTVVVQHPGRVLTLYAGLDRLRVREGDVLSFGAGVGDAGTRLYFEVRVETRPEDPRSWLR